MNKITLKQDRLPKYIQNAIDSDCPAETQYGLDKSHLSTEPLSLHTNALTRDIGVNLTSLNNGHKILLALPFKLSDKQKKKHALLYVTSGKDQTDLTEGVYNFFHPYASTRNGDATFGSGTKVGATNIGLLNSTKYFDHMVAFSSDVTDLDQYHLAMHMSNEHTQRNWCEVYTGNSDKFDHGLLEETVEYIAKLTKKLDKPGSYFDGLIKNTSMIRLITSDVPFTEVFWEKNLSTLNSWMEINDELTFKALRDPRGLANFDLPSKIWDEKKQAMKSDEQAKFRILELNPNSHYDSFYINLVSEKDMKITIAKDDKKYDVTLDIDISYTPLAIEGNDLKKLSPADTKTVNDLQQEIMNIDENTVRTNRDGFRIKGSELTKFGGRLYNPSLSGDMDSARNRLDASPIHQIESTTHTLFTELCISQSEDPCVSVKSTVGVSTYDIRVTQIREKETQEIVRDTLLDINPCFVLMPHHKVQCTKLFKAVNRALCKSEQPKLINFMQKHNLLVPNTKKCFNFGAGKGKDKLETQEVVCFTPSPDQTEWIELEHYHEALTLTYNAKLALVLAFKNKKTGKWIENVKPMYTEDLMSNNINFVCASFTQPQITKHDEEIKGHNSITKGVPTFLIKFSEMRVLQNKKYCLELNVNVTPNYLVVEEAEFVKRSPLLRAPRIKENLFIDVETDMPFYFPHLNLDTVNNTPVPRVTCTKCGNTPCTCEKPGKDGGEGGNLTKCWAREFPTDANSVYPLFLVGDVFHNRPVYNMSSDIFDYVLNAQLHERLANNDQLKRAERALRDMQFDLTNVGATLRKRIISHEGSAPLYKFEKEMPNIPPIKTPEMIYLVEINRYVANYLYGPNKDFKGISKLLFALNNDTQELNHYKGLILDMIDKLTPIN